MKVVNLPGPSLWIAILLACGGAARAGEFQVNQFTTYNQRRPAISHDSSGGFVILLFALWSWRHFGRRRMRGFGGWVAPSMALLSLGAKENHALTAPMTCEPGA